jgi:MFS family permease
VTKQTRFAGGAEIRANWVVLVGGFLGVTFGIASMFGYTIGVFMKPLQAEFGWSRSEISLGLLLSTLTTGITAPLIGLVADRIDLRKLIVASTIGLAFSFLAFANLWNALWFFMLMMVVKSFLSAGTSPVVYTRMINQWFDRSRGLALGLILAGNGVAGALLPRFLAPYVAEHGWRAGYLAIAGLVAITAPFIWIMARDRRTVRTVPGAVPAIAEGAGPTMQDAIRTRTFWILALTLLFPALGIGGIAIHIIPMMSDAGLSPARAGAVAGLLGIAVIIGRIFTGSLIDRFFAPRVAATIFAITAVGFVGLATLGVGFAPYAVFLVGIATGAEVDIIGYLLARYFGMRAYGVLYGILYAAFMLGTSLSQMIASAAFDTTGSYQLYMIIAVGCLLGGSLMALLLPRFEGAAVSSSDAASPPQPC